MKIGIVMDDTLDKTDGVQQAVLTIGNWLRHEGHVVHYLVAETSRTDIPNVHSLGKFVNLRFNRNTVRTPLPASKKRIRALLSSEQYDVLHVMMPCSPFLGEQIVRLASPTTAVIGTFHTLPASRVSGLSHHALHLLLLRSLKRFDTVIGVSEPTVKFARKTYGMQAIYVPNPVVVEDFRRGRRLGAYNRKKLNIVFLGRLVKRKGVLELINAYISLDTDLRKKSRLIVCGKGPLKQKAKQLAANDEGIIFAGFVPEKDKADYLASADIAIFPSISGEAFGIVLVEAMAAGAGVVTGGNNPGYASVLSQQPYLLFNASDPAAFKAQLELLITDERLRERMHAWQEEVVGQYDISVIGPQLEDCYQQALHRRLEVR